MYGVNPLDFSRMTVCIHLRQAGGNGGLDYSFPPLSFHFFSSFFPSFFTHGAPVHPARSPRPPPPAPPTHTNAHTFPGLPRRLARTCSLSLTTFGPDLGCSWSAIFALGGPVGAVLCHPPPPPTHHAPLSFPESRRVKLDFYIIVML